MRPLPAPPSTTGHTSGETIPALPTTLTSVAGSYSKANRRVSNSIIPRIYPWLLLFSTALAALFCLMYITKPIILTPSTTLALPTPATSPRPSPTKMAATTQTNMLPRADHLPGDPSTPVTGIKPATSTAPRGISTPPPAPVFEETNLRIQHILTAQAPGGHLARIDLEVPVLYQSRNLRWTPANVTEARQLLVRLMDYQEKSQRLRADGLDLLDCWNRLIGNSLPAADLRADSPSLPANQTDTAGTPHPVGLITTESIQIQPAGK